MTNNNEINKVPQGKRPLIYRCPVCSKLYNESGDWSFDPSGDVELEEFECKRCELKGTENHYGEDDNG